MNYQVVHILNFASLSKQTKYNNCYLHSGSERPLRGVFCSWTGQTWVWSSVQEKDGGGWVQICHCVILKWCTLYTDKKKLSHIYAFKLMSCLQAVGGACALDGCATFFRRDRFSHVKKYEVQIHSPGYGALQNFSQHWEVYSCMQVEFNKAAQSLTEAVVPSAQKKAALNRLLKVAFAFQFVLAWTWFCFLKCRD